MVIGGLQKLSLIDYPGHLSVIVFTDGCNFRCGFCYNPMLVLPSEDRNIKDHSLVKEDDLFDFLKKRTGKLEAVVITGGEPTMHKDLPKLLKKIRKLGYKIKLDTNGTNPEMLKALTSPQPLQFGAQASSSKGEGEKLVDYIAMDVKAPLEKYRKVTGSKVDLEKIKKSIKIIMKAKVPYEFRTTVVPTLLEKEDISKMGEMIKNAREWHLQQFQPKKDLINKELQKLNPYTDKEMQEMVKIAKKFVKKCTLR